MMEENVMEIRIHLNNSKTLSFTQKDKDEALELMNSIRPTKLFSQPQILIQDIDSTSSLSCLNIEWIEFITHVRPEWDLVSLPGIPMLLSEEEYQSNFLRKGFGGLQNKGDTSAAEENSYKLFFCFLLRSGERLFGLLPARSRELINLRLRINTDSTPEGIIAKGEKIGYVLINTQNIIHWEIDFSFENPGRNVWRANRN